jgi:hypothetical protein
MRCRVQHLIVLLLSGCMPDVIEPANPPVVTAVFDPTASPPAVPLPNDLAFRGGDGVHLAIVDQPTDSPAQRDFNAYLRTLDGFPTASTASAAFSAPLDPASIAGAVLVIDTQTGMRVEGITTTLSRDGKRIIVTPGARWLPAHRYAVLVMGGRDPAGVRGANGELTVASPTFFLLRSPNPLLARCIDPTNPECVCADIADASCHSVARGVDDATARAAEAERRMLDPGLTLLVAATGRNRNDIVLAWTFTITSLPTAVFDPSRSAIPFPNDLLIDRASGLVNLPITPGDPRAALMMKLNTLDGFSVSAPITASLDLRAGDTLAAPTLQPNALLVNLDPRPGAEQPSFVAVQADSRIALQPLRALVSDQARYGVVLIRGITDAAGRALEPSPAMVLVRGPNPVFDGMHSTVSVLSDEQAAQLEPLRVAFQPLFAALGAAGVPRERVSLAWTFTTQSIVRPLQAVDRFPAQTALDTDVTFSTVVADAALEARAPMLPFATANVRAMVLGSFGSKDVIDRAQGQIVFDRGDEFRVRVPPGDPPTVLRFWLSLPRVPASAAGAPVVILQHGLTSWRGDMVALADQFAAAGWAAIAIDMPLHGARTVCTADAQCDSGSCASGVCAAGLRPVPLSQNPRACSLQPLSGDPLDCNPIASGNTFVNPADLFLTRANGQWYVLDAAQLVRVIRGSSLNAQLATAGFTLDSTRIAFLGYSLGAIGGTLWGAVDPAAQPVVLNAGGAHLFDALASGAFAPVVDQYLESIGVQRGTPAFAELAATARWVLDGIDPFSVGRRLGQSRPVILQETGMDTVLPPPFQEELGLTLFGPTGLDAMHHLLGRQNDGTVASTYFPAANHGTLLSGMPPEESVPMRTQAVTFITSGGATLPASH